VRRSVYFAFFGRPAETSTRSHLPRPQDSDAEQARSRPFYESRSTPAEEGGQVSRNLEQDDLATPEGERFA
jgi:hypothetical protein